MASIPKDTIRALQPSLSVAAMVGLPAGRIAPNMLRHDGYRTATPNERLILSLVRDRETISQAQLARASELTAQSVKRIVDALIERGLLLEGDPVAAGRGKPSTPLRLNSEAAFSIGLSIMTDAIALVIMDFGGAIRWTMQSPMADVRPDRAIDQMRGMIDRALSEARIDRSKVIGAGVGITGYFVDHSARVNPPRQLEPWALIPLDSLLAEGLGMPVWIDNDGNVATVGEAMVGAGRSVRNFAYLYFSAGFGGGIFVDGRPTRGRSGNAGEFAAVIPLDWPQPNLEQLRLRVNEAGGEFIDLNSLLPVVLPATPGVDIWMKDAIKSLNLVISAISAIFDPDLIVFGGRMPTALAEALIPHLDFFNPPRRDHPRPVPMLVPSRIEHDAAAVGAASIALRSAYFESI